MKIKHLFSLLFIIAACKSFSQTIYGAVAPDSIRKQCEKVIISEIGANAFTNHVKFIKSDAHTKEKVLNGYTLFYSFGFPNVKESHVVFTIDYKLSPSKNGVVQDAALKNYTRLPIALKKKDISVISYNDAKKSAVAADTVLKKYQDKLYGEISTEYNSTKKDYYFVWYFYYLEACKTCKEETYTTHSVYIDAVSGKKISN